MRQFTWAKILLIIFINVFKNKEYFLGTWWRLETFSAPKENVRWKGLRIIDIAQYLEAVEYVCFLNKVKPPKIMYMPIQTAQIYLPQHYIWINRKQTYYSLYNGFQYNYSLTIQSRISETAVFSSQGVIVIMYHIRLCILANYSWLSWHYYR